MEESREGDCRVPLISSLLCLCVTAGGVLLFIYVYKPSASRPWFPIAALLMIGSPWIFWVLTYMYTCIKACVRRNRLKDRQISRRSYPGRSTATSSCNTMGRNESVNEPSVRSSTDGGKHVHFGGVVVDDGESSRGKERRDSSVTSSKEIEMPLSLSVAS